MYDVQAEFHMILNSAKVGEEEWIYSSIADPWALRTLNDQLEPYHIRAYKTDDDMFIPRIHYKKTE